MNYRWLIPGLLLLAAALACGPAQTNTPQTASAAATQTARAAHTVTAAAPRPTLNLNPNAKASDTPAPSDTPEAASPTDQSAGAATDTPVALELPADTATPAPSATPRQSATPQPSATPRQSATPTRRPTARATAGPSFLDTVVAVRKQVENFGGQIDIAVGSGKLDCQQAVNSYEYVAARATIKNVPANMAGAYSLYTQAVNIFIPKAADLYTNCKNFLANPSPNGSIPALQWTVARTAVTNADQLLRQAVIAAGGTP